jgi:hypothetical protein
MEKAQLPLIAELSLTDTKDSTAKITADSFSGSDNPRYLRVLYALLIRPCRREEIDRIAGASNGPDLIAELRRCGLSIPCHMMRGVDRDGFPVKFGVYEFSEEDRRKVSAWLQRGNLGVRV